MYWVFLRLLRQLLDENLLDPLRDYPIFDNLAVIATLSIEKDSGVSPHLQGSACDYLEEYRAIREGL